ncbi:MAG: ABC transporter permease [Bacillales bacterium]|nr:ABC transporter permease [Bacillales bacterium]
MKKINSVKEYKKQIKKEKIKIHTIQISLGILFLLAWEILTRANIVNSFLLSSPLKVFSLFVTYLNSGEIFSHIYISTLETLLGLIISLSGGIIIATILYLSPSASRALDPYLVLLNALPKSAIAPILIIWLGTGLKGIVGVSVSFVMIITIINVLNYFNHVDSDLITMMKSMKASKLQILMKVVFPSNIMNILSTIKVCIGLSWVGVIVGEYLSSKRGLGYLVMYGGQVFKLDLVMMGIFILAILALIMYSVIALIEKILKKKYKLN